MAGTLGPTVAGTWYAADRDALGAQIDALLADPAPPPVERPAAVSALIAPHAGYVYSGRVAANAFLHVAASRPDRVILLGPSHYEAFPGGAVPAAETYRTPLGEIALDTAAIGALASRPGFRRDDRPFLREHSLEAEIPFLQRVLAPGWRLLPVLLGAGSPAGELAAVADALAPHCAERGLVVVSSDFTHYGPRFRYTPFRTDVPRRIEALDLGAVECVVARDASAFEAYVAETAATICGRAAVGVLLRLLSPDSEGRLTAYDTSGRMTGDWEHSVSYAAIVFSRPPAGDARC